MNEELDLDEDMEEEDEEPPPPPPPAAETGTLPAECIDLLVTVEEVDALAPAPNESSSGDSSSAAGCAAVARAAAIADCGRFAADCAKEADSVLLTGGSAACSGAV